MNMIGAVEKATQAFEDINTLVKMNPHYVHAARKGNKSLIVEFHGLGQDKKWFYSAQKRQAVNAVRIELEYSGSKELPRIKFLDFLPFHPNIDHGQQEFDNDIMLHESNLHVETNAGHLVAFIWGLLTYQIVEQKHVKNFQAYEWYKNNRAYFPLTNIALQLRTMTSGFKIKSPQRDSPAITPQSLEKINSRQNLAVPSNVISDEKKSFPQREHVVSSSPKEAQTSPLFKVKNIQKFIPKQKEFPVDTGSAVNWSAPVITIRQSALNQILIHGSADKDHEQFGILMGGVYENPRNGGKWLEIVEMVPAERHKGNASYVEVSAQEVAEMTRKSEVLRDQYPDACRLGWYHTHPGHTIFMSPTDRSNHRNVYRADWQVALVYDPKNNLYGFFFGLECWPVPENNIILIRDQLPTPIAILPQYQEKEAILRHQPAPSREILSSVTSGPGTRPTPIETPPESRFNFSRFLKGALLIGFIGCVGYIGYWIGKTNEIKNIGNHQPTTVPTAATNLETERQKWIAEQQSQIISNVLEQVNQGNVDTSDRARLIGHLEVAINLDKKSPLAQDAQNLIELLRQGTPTPSATSTGALPTSTDQAIGTSPSTGTTSPTPGP